MHGGAAGFYFSSICCLRTASSGWPTSCPMSSWVPKIWRASPSTPGPRSQAQTRDSQGLPHPPRPHWPSYTGSYGSEGCAAGVGTRQGLGCSANRQRGGGAWGQAQGWPGGELGWRCAYPFNNHSTTIQQPIQQPIQQCKFSIQQLISNILKDF